MERYTVACVQQRLRLPLTTDELRESLRRFMRAAENKRARLLIFPELAGMMIVPPLLVDFRSSLLKRADVGRRRSATLWQKMVGAISGSAAGMLKANFQTGLAGLLDVASGDLWESYSELFGGLAKEFGVTIVAPSIYLPDPFDGVIRNLAAVFGPDGALLGTQAKVMLTQEDEFFCQPGTTWDVIHTEMGALGLMLGGDVLYPEVGRLLAFHGAEALICMGAAGDQATYNKLRAGVLARMQDNQIFAACAFLVGRNYFAPAPDAVFLGKSAIFAPQELTPRFNGVLVEMGNFGSEGVLTAEWDFVALKELWAKSETSVRNQMNASQASQMLAALYRQLQSLPRLEDQGEVEPAGNVSNGSPQNRPERMSLDDLPVIASVTSRWPPRAADEGDIPLHEAVNWTIDSPCGRQHGQHARPALRRRDRRDGCTGRRISVTARRRVLLTPAHCGDHAAKTPGPTNTGSFPSPSGCTQTPLRPSSRVPVKTKASPSGDQTR